MRPGAVRQAERGNGNGNGNGNGGQRKGGDVGGPPLLLWLPPLPPPCRVSLHGAPPPSRNPPRGLPSMIHPSCRARKAAAHAVSDTGAPPHRILLRISNA